MVKTFWLYSLRKEELSEICGSLDLDTEGTVEEMRKAMTALIATADLTTEMKAKLTELETKYAPKMLQLSEGTVRGASRKRHAQEQISCGAVMNRICKWSLRYDGESCALEFIARIEELCEDLMRHLEYTTQQKLDRIARNSQREYQLFFGDTTGKDLSEMIALGERFEDIPTVATTPRLRQTTEIPRPLGENAPITRNINNASRNGCHRCAQPGHLARDYRNQRVLFCWDCGRPGVLTKDCCRQTPGQHIQARGMTVYESIERRKPPPDAVPRTVKMTGSTLVASLTIGGLATTGVVDTGATRSIIREDFIGFIPHITHSKTKTHTIRMVDGASEDSKRSITVEVRIGDMTFNLELLVVRRRVDHLTLGMDFLAKTGAVLTVVGYSVKLGGKKSTPTATTAAKGTRASAMSKISPTPDPLAISSSMHAQTKTLERTTAVRKARTTSLSTRNKAAKPATTRPDIPEPKYGIHERVANATAKPARAYKESQSVTAEPKSRNVFIAKILIAGSAHVSTNTKISTTDRGRSATTGKTSETTTEVRKARTMPLSTKNKAAKAATTRPDIPELKYGTHERVVNATVRSARAFKELHSVTTRGDTTITIVASRKTNKNKKDLDYRSKADKVNGNSSKTSINNRGLCLHHRPQQGQFNKLAPPSPNIFYVTSTNLEQSSDLSKQTHGGPNHADKWLPRHQGADNSSSPKAGKSSAAAITAAVTSTSRSARSHPYLRAQQLQQQPHRPTFAAEKK
uniref:CCHC-type domain-containing protein n=1 Tax=Glossina palpalis gambiensis TaxID=67801 RepID=A0A1B0B454_9MUSC